jgi:hypothetical protein
MSQLVKHFKEKTKIKKRSLNRNMRTWQRFNNSAVKILSADKNNQSEKQQIIIF